MTPMQERQTQIDGWTTRHDFPWRLEPATRADLTANAIAADHAEALEMNANDDAGRAAFLGRQPAAPSDRTRLAAVTRSLGDGIQLGQIPTPTSITVWTHHMTFVNFLTYADRNGARVTIVDDDPTAPWARLKILVGVDLLPAGHWVEIYCSCRDVSPAALAAYLAHNERLAAEAEVPA
jgi:hypothetical protein